MKFRGSGKHTGGKVELMMTPMIDVVFQLLTFFIMTFKITAPEGDFFIKMPQAAPSAGVPSDVQLPPIKVRMTAGANSPGYFSQNGDSRVLPSCVIRSAHWSATLPDLGERAMPRWSSIATMTSVMSM